LRKKEFVVGVHEVDGELVTVIISLDYLYALNNVVGHEVLWQA
jgi:hypothetical protein